MIKHIVFFKIADSTSTTKTIEELKLMLEDLPTHIPQIIDYEVGKNISTSANAYDLALDSTFANEAELNVYRVHSRHTEVVDFIKSNQIETAVVDYVI